MPDHAYPQDSVRARPLMQAGKGPIARRALLAAGVMIATASCATRPAPKSEGPMLTAVEKIDLYDGARKRDIPVTLYGHATGSRARPLAILSHGLGSPSTSYSFIADALARRGYVVAAIQYELPGDPPLAMGENLFVRRFPNWQRGADTIGFVIATLRARGIAMHGRKAVLIGHSNGGDTSMLFARQHPGLVHAVLTLDNRRMPLLRVRDPRICSIRSIDQPADPGVLPTAEERRALHIQVTTIDGLGHNAMSNWATNTQKAAMLTFLWSCL